MNTYLDCLDFKSIVRGDQQALRMIDWEKIINNPQILKEYFNRLHQFEEKITGVTSGTYTQRIPGRKLRSLNDNGKHLQSDINGNPSKVITPARNVTLPQSIKHIIDKKRISIKVIIFWLYRNRRVKLTHSQIGKLLGVSETVTRQHFCRTKNAARRREKWFCQEYKKLLCEVKEIRRKAKSIT